MRPVQLPMDWPSQKPCNCSAYCFLDKVRSALFGLYPLASIFLFFISFCEDKIKQEPRMPIKIIFRYLIELF